MDFYPIEAVENGYSKFITGIRGVRDEAVWDVTEIKEKEKNCPKTFNNVRCERQYGWEIGRAGEQTRPGQADTPIVLKGQFLCTHASLS